MPATSLDLPSRDLQLAKIDANTLAKIEVAIFLWVLDETSKGEKHVDRGRKS